MQLTLLLDCLAQIKAKQNIDVDVKSLPNSL